MEAGTNILRTVHYFSEVFYFKNWCSSRVKYVRFFAASSKSTQFLVLALIIIDIKLKRYI